jgi:ribosomal protein S18 acetylase RimI-like enzyme
LEQGGGFVALDDARMVGVVLYEPHPDYLYLGRLAVLPEYRGQQIASRLTARVEQEALDRQLRRVRLGVRIALPGNQALFQHLGYRMISFHSHEGYTDYTYVMMEKALRPRP